MAPTVLVSCLLSSATSELLVINLTLFTVAPIGDTVCFNRKKIYDDVILT